MRALTFPLRAAGRIALAIKFWAALDYTWHLAWIKAER